MNRKASRKYGSPSSGTLSLLGGLALLCSTGPALAQISSGNRPAYRSPMDVAYSTDGLLAVADRTWPGVVIINPSDGSMREKKLEGDPYHVVWNGTDKVLVAEGNNGTVAEVDVSGKDEPKVLRRIPIGMVAKGLAITKDGRLLVCDRAANRLVVVKLASGEIEFTVPVGREPGTVTVTKDGKTAIVGNKLPKPGDPLHGTPAAEISIVDLTSKQVRTVGLVKQATMVRQVVLSPDEKYVYVTHQSPRGGLPVTQLDNGWVMTNAMSIIDLAAGTLYANFLFDRSGAGGAHPWGVAVDSKGTKLWVALEGVREVATVDLTALNKRLTGSSAQERLDLITNLSALQTDGTIKRTVFKDIDGPRGVAVSPDGSTLAVGAYYSQKVLLLKTSDLTVSKTIALNNPPAEDQVRMGERYYYTATNCYQSWLSCSSCHDEGRPDGLNWDLQNDGTGNPKQTKSHVYSNETPPTNVSGCRENAEVSCRAGYQFIEFQAAPEDRVQPTYAFVKSIMAEPSPFLGPDGQLTADAVEGKKIFEGDGGCSGCHSGPYFTDMKKHDIGTRKSGTEGPDNNPNWDVDGWDTPTLVELWRTAPYLHLGSAMTVEEVLTTENKKGLHGNGSKLSADQLKKVAAYVLQIGPTRKVENPPPPSSGGSSGSSSAVTPSGGAGGSSSATEPSSSGGMGGSSWSASAAGGGGGGGGETNSSDSSSMGGAVGGSNNDSMAGSASSSTDDAQSKSSSCICHLGARRSSGGGLPVVLIALSFALVALKKPRRRT